ncbi:hypothetical protein KXT27_24650, partial [Salmonella enterica subsp. enterica serovar Weltevreden]|nr:hypothetical protein [Salmonella enterica subsp. enterica serovar Weltevreden]
LGFILQIVKFFSILAQLSHLISENKAEKNDVPIIDIHTFKGVLELVMSQFLGLYEIHSFDEFIYLYIYI